MKLASSIAIKNSGSKVAQTVKTKAPGKKMPAVSDKTNGHF